MKVYEGKRDDGNNASVMVGVLVGTATTNRKPLALRLDLRPHSPTGFEWGYHGSGPAQLALALCADVVGDERAVLVYQEFKRQHVATWPNGFRMTEEQIRTAVSIIEAAAK